MLRAVRGGRGRVRHGIRGAGFGTTAGGEVASPWSVTRKGSDITLSNGNFTGSSAGQTGDWCQTDSLVSVSAGKVYWEFLVNTKNSDFFYAAFIDSTVGYEDTGGPGSPSCMWRASGLWSVGGGSNPAAFTTGDVLGMAVDLGGTNKIRAFLNGVEGGLSAAITPTTGQWRLGAVNTFGTSPNVITIRTTLAQFSFAPPAGYVSWGSVAI